MAVCLAEGMVLAKNISADGYMCVKNDARGDGLMAENWVQYVVG